MKDIYVRSKCTKSLVDGVSFHNPLTEFTTHSRLRIGALLLETRSHLSGRKWDECLLARITIAAHHRLYCPYESRHKAVTRNDIECIQ